MQVSDLAAFKTCSPIAGFYTLKVADLEKSLVQSQGTSIITFKANSLLCIFA